jgi:pimeloyl-ACP methyl ester carboxylesterase
MNRRTWILSIPLLALLSPVVAGAASEPNLSNVAALPTPAAGADGTADTTTAASERYRPNRIEWTPCDDNVAAECATLTLPVDYDDPDGETFDMAVARTVATDPANRIGVLFTNPGGPGYSGVDFINFAIAGAPSFAPFRERFDIVSFDPRGVARSRGIQCSPTDIDLTLPDDVTDDAALIEAFDGFSRAYADDCLSRDGSFIGQVSTNNVARDMDALRRALGERKVTYASGSYGSQLGAVYASLFPRRLRAMALDGGADPTFRDFYAESTALQMEAFEMELQRIDTLCRDDAECLLAEIGVVDALDKLIDQLDEAPVTTPNGATITGSTVVSAVYSLIYREANAPVIVQMLSNALAGDLSFVEQVTPSVDAGLDVGAIYAIRCNDYGTRRHAAEYLPVDEVVGARNLRFFGRFYLAYRLATCADLPPADPPVIRDVSQKVDVPILVVANDFDPATPPAGMLNTAHALGMDQTVVRYQGGGHTYPKNNGCMNAIFGAYLFDLVVPEPSTACAGADISFATPDAASTAAGADIATGEISDDQMWAFAEPSFTLGR